MDVYVANLGDEIVALTKSQRQGLSRYLFSRYHIIWTFAETQSEFDDEFIIDTFGPLSDEARERWERVKRKGIGDGCR